MPYLTLIFLWADSSTGEHTACICIMRVRFSLGPPFTEDSLIGKTPDCKSGALLLVGSSPTPPTKTLRRY